MCIHLDSYNYHHSNNHNNHSNQHKHSHRKKGVKRHGNIHITTKEVQFSSFDKETESVQQELKNHIRSHHTKARSSVSNAKRLMNTLQLKRETKRKEKLKDKLKSGIAKMNISRTVAAAQKVRMNTRKKTKNEKIINCNFFFCMNETIFFVSFNVFDFKLLHFSFFLILFSFSLFFLFNSHQTITITSDRQKNRWLILQNDKMN